MSDQRTDALVSDMSIHSLAQLRNRHRRALALMVVCTVADVFVVLVFVSIGAPGSGFWSALGLVLSGVLVLVGARQVIAVTQRLRALPRW